MLQGLVKEAIEDKLKSVRYENGIIRIIKDFTYSPLYEPKMTKEMLENEKFITSDTTIVKIETRTA